MTRKNLLLLVCIIAVLLLGAIGFFIKAVRDESVAVTTQDPHIVREKQVKLPEVAQEVDKDVPRERKTDISYSGKKESKVKMVIYTDLECPFCKKLHTVLPAITTEFGNSVEIVFRHFPLTIHPSAHMEAEVVNCAIEQSLEKGIRLIDKTYAETTSSGTTYNLGQYLDLGASVDLDRSKLTLCMEQNRYAKSVDEDLESGRSLGVRLTPTVFFLKEGTKTVMVEGARSKEEYQDVLNYFLQ
ncbi:MAG TPA: DsbA family protein [Verrucomicrobiae bacterium]|nr:DsbA family protein [Verrucomicrobiae bacterium]